MVKDLKRSMLDNRKRLHTNLVYRVINPARYLLDLARLYMPYGAGGAKGHVDGAHRFLLVSDARASTSEEQFSPFSLYRTDLRNRLKLITLHLLLKDVLRSPKFVIKPFDVVILKMSFQTSGGEALNVIRSIEGVLDGRRLVYFDGDDDLCVQWPEILRYVNLYVKKHLFRDRNEYLRRFVGKSNLTDFVHRHYNFSFADNPIATETQPLAKEHLSKLSIFCNLATDRNIVNLYRCRQINPVQGAKKYDIVFRGSVPNNWMSYLRQDIGPALERLGKYYRVITPFSRVPIEEYYLEMQSSRVCISPFGYGEICWRDFEAVLCGCLLVKPDMGHVETSPDIFKPYQTYVPVRWDFSDLEEKCSYYLEHDVERQHIVDRAFEVLDSFYKGDDIMKAAFKFMQHSDPSKGTTVASPEL